MAIVALLFNWGTNLCDDAIIMIYDTILLLHPELLVSSTIFSLFLLCVFPFLS